MTKIKKSIIDDDKIWTTRMFTKEGWKRLRNDIPDVTKDSSDVALADAFMDFVDIWIDDNGYDMMDVFNPDIIKKEYQIFHDCDEDGDVDYYFKGDLEDVLRTRFAEWVLGD